jgi:O-antigen ligase
LINLRKIKLSAEQLIYYLSCGALFALPLGTSSFTIFGICILCVWVFSGQWIKKRRLYFREPWFWPVLAIMALIWIGLIYSPDPEGLGIKFAKKTHYWLYAFAVGGILFTKYPAQNLIKALLMGLFLNALAGFLQMAHIVPTFDTWGMTKYTGFSGGYNTLSLLLTLGIMVASFNIRAVESRKAKLTYIILMLTYFCHLIILEGRGGYLTFALLSPIVIYNLFGRLYRGAIFLIYPLIIGIMLSSPIIRNRVSLSVQELKHHLSADPESAWGKAYTVHQDRFYMWRGAIELFVENPLFGVGTGGYGTALKERGKEEWPKIAHPHNNLLYVAVSFGIVGLIVFGWFFWVLLKGGWMHRKSPKGFFVFCSGLVILAGGIVDTPLLNADSSFLLAVVTGLLSALPKERVLSQPLKSPSVPL